MIILPVLYGWETLCHIKGSTYTEGVLKRRIFGPAKDGVT
jgi:hypothetical protein